MDLVPLPLTLKLSSFSRLLLVYESPWVPPSPDAPAMQEVVGPGNPPVAASALRTPGSAHLARGFSRSEQSKPWANSPSPEGIDPRHTARLPQSAALSRYPQIHAAHPGLGCSVSLPKLTVRACGSAPDAYIAAASEWLACFTPYVRLVYNQMQGVIGRRHDGRDHQET